MSAPISAAAVPEAPVVVSGASKWYGDTVALSDVSFTLQPGVTGLLGHNGAGKSTTLALLAGFVGVSQGEVRVLGMDPRTEPDVHRRLGVVTDGEGIWPHLTARETVELLARQRGVADAATAAAAALDGVGLTGAADRKVSGFSKGMRQRVKLAQALVHDPQVLLLDEPLNGLDPAQRRADVELVRRLGAEGRTVLVSSHVLGEVERMADRLLVVVNGRLVAEGTAAGIRDLMTDRPRSVRIVTDDVRRLAGALLAAGLVHSVQVDGDAMVVETSHATKLGTELPSVAQEVDAVLRRVVPVGEDLESVFAALTRAARGVGR